MRKQRIYYAKLISFFAKYKTQGGG